MTPMTDLSMDSLVQAAQSGQTRANHLLYDRFQPCIRRLLGRYRYLSCADDMTGETYLLFTDLVRRFDRKRGIPFASYVSKMLAASVYTWVRRERLTTSREISGLDTPGEWRENGGYAGTSLSHSATAVSTEKDLALEPVMERDTVTRLMAALTPRQAFVFEQRALKGEEFSDIAQQVHSSPAAARVMYHAARKRLQERWRQLYAADV